MSEGCQTRRMFRHDYAVPGTYEVTMVVAGRRPVFGEVVGSTKGDGEKPHLKPSLLGLAVLDHEIPKIHHYYPEVDIWQVCLMPDHLHLIVRINRPLPKGKHLGIIMGAFKGGVSRAWWQMETTVSAASAAESRPPLFEPNYNDHILMHDGQLDNWKRYLRDNPLRYMMRREYPDLFQRALCVTIGGTRYSAFGNMCKPTPLANIGNPSAAALRPVPMARCLSLHHGPRICRPSPATTSVSTSSITWPRWFVPSAIRRTWGCEACKRP